MSRAARRKARRRARDAAVRARVILPIDPRWPRWIERRAQRRQAPWLMPAMAAASAAAHLSIAFLPGAPVEPPAPQRVAVEVRELPAPLAEPEATAPTPTPEPAPAPEPAPQPRAESKRSPERAPAPAPEPGPPPPPVIGLDFESTVEGGSGPAFATGNSRAGQTERRARDPRSIPPAPAPGPTPEPVATSTPNRAASRIPGAGGGGQLVKPKRLRSLQPAYPEVLKARGIEANVTVAVRLDASGRVARVELVSGSDHEEFNRAALATARRERFSPARRGERPVDYTLTFTYRFRLSDA